jgi:diguanylate cyclase (GGDEF)-like protein
MMPKEPVAKDHSAGTHRRAWLILTAIRLAAVFAGYWLTWNISGLFLVEPEISALYLGAGMTVAVALLLGVAWLPVAFVIDQVVAGYIDLTGLTLGHVAVYGAMGLYLRHTWFLPRRRFSLQVAVQFVSLALVAALAASLLNLWVRSWRTLPPEAASQLVLSFWGGDFAGVLVAVPLILMLHGLLVSFMGGGEARFRTVLRSIDVLPVVGLGLLGFAVAFLVAWLPPTLGVATEISVLLLFPVVLAGLAHGTLIGFAVTGIALVTYLTVGAHFGSYLGQPVGVQLLLAISTAVALLTGAAHDDRQHEWQRAHVDLLTGMPNRRLLADRIEQAWRHARRSGDPMAILCLDLDHFKDVNDSLGHDAGDQLLVQVAGRIKGCLRASDTVARTGGDEFVILLPELDAAASVDRVAGKILRTFDRPFPLGEQAVSMSASLGAAVYPADGEDPDTLRLRADTALYAAKADGRNGYRRWQAAQPLH